MLIWSLSFLVVAIVVYAVSLKVVSGKAFTDGKFMAVVFVALFSLTLLCIAVSMKVACPTPDKWLNLRCLNLSMESLL